MWTREELKTRAKEILRTTYWQAFLVSLILILVSGGGGGGGTSNPSSTPGGSEMAPVWAVIIVIFVILVVLVLIAFRIFVGAPLEVGCRRFFARAAQQECNLGYIGYAFTRERYLEIVKGMVWKDLINLLWFLLLIIPGIIKYYAYRMTPYILADNPRIGYKRALELSIQMTNGEKGDIFILDLSFIGWYLLGLLACCIGILFVNPYFYATEAELYLVLKQKALQDGLCTPDELGENRAVPMQDTI